MFRALWAKLFPPKPPPPPPQPPDEQPGVIGDILRMGEAAAGDTPPPKP